MHCGGWHCEKLAEYDEQITNKEEEIEALERRIAASEAAAREPPHAVSGHSASGESIVAADAHGTSIEFSGHSSVCSHVAGGGATEPRALRMAFDGATKSGRKTAGPAAVHGHGLPHAEGPRRGKAPPVDPFSSEAAGVTFDDWYPSLQRTAHWNQWTEQDTLI